MKKFSSTNLVRLSDGSKISRQILESRTRKAKEDFKWSYGVSFPFCQCCGKNANAGKRLSVSHIISVKECIETGKSEMAYNEANFQLECNECHQEWENKGNNVFKQMNFENKCDFIEEHFNDTFKRLRAKNKI